MKKLAEANFQKKLTTDLRNQGWKIIKLQSGMGYTVLDLFATSRLYGPMWIELKTMPSIGCKIPLTTLQRQEMRALQANGVLSIVASCVRTGRDDRLFISTNPDEEYVNDEWIERKHGEEWNAGIIGRRCDFERTRVDLWGQWNKPQVHA